MKDTHSAFHWLDHVIGKRESRRIRDDHNRLYNDYCALFEAAKEARLLNTALRLNGPSAKTVWDNLDKAAGWTIGELTK